MSREVVVSLIGATTTARGRIQAAVDIGPYPTGVKVSDAEVTALQLERAMQLYDSASSTPQIETLSERLKWILYFWTNPKNTPIAVERIPSMSGIINQHSMHPETGVIAGTYVR